MPSKYQNKHEEEKSDGSTVFTCLKNRTSDHSGICLFIGAKDPF